MTDGGSGLPIAENTSSTVGRLSEKFEEIDKTEESRRGGGWGFRRVYVWIIRGEVLSVSSVPRWTSLGEERVATAGARRVGVFDIEVSGRSWSEWQVEGGIKWVVQRVEWIYRQSLILYLLFLCVKRMVGSARFSTAAVIRVINEAKEMILDCNYEPTNQITAKR